MLEWLVVGGGPHGVHAALRLIADAGVSRDAVRIVDDERQLLARWRRTTRNTGMQFLRSPGVHHVGRSAGSLTRFAERAGKRVDKPFTRPYGRPALELFDLHCDDQIARHRLDELHVRGRVRRLDLSSAGATVGYAASNDGVAGELRARRVILAIGAPREPEWPEWARCALAAGTDGRVRHIFDPGFELVDDDDDDVAVIGAGISGAQVALRLARPGRRVLLVSRHGLRVHQFDSDPGWLGPKHMDGFARLADPDERRERIREARLRGSMPPEVHKDLLRAVRTGAIELVEAGDVLSARVSPVGVSVELEGRSLRADRVLLATGFPSRRPGEAWLDAAIEAHGLSCAACGYPIVDRGLRWHPRLLVTGALAELELGPVARNLSGAQRAGERILAVAHAASRKDVAC